MCHKTRSRSGASGPRICPPRSRLTALLTSGGAGRARSRTNGSPANQPAPANTRTPTTDVDPLRRLATPHEPNQPFTRSGSEPCSTTSVSTPAPAPPRGSRTWCAPRSSPDSFARHPPTAHHPPASAAFEPAPSATSQRYRASFPESIPPEDASNQHGSVSTAHGMRLSGVTPQRRIGRIYSSPRKADMAQPISVATILDNYSAARFFRV